MPEIISKTILFKQNYLYKFAGTKLLLKHCLKVIDIDTQSITFIDNSGNFRKIEAEYLPFWGYDIFAEILADYYGSNGLNINTSRRLEYYEEAKSCLDENDFLRFCNDNKHRWILNGNS
jgi:hypothetical protein